MAPQVKIYTPGQSDDPGVEWSANVLTTLADMLGEFVLAVVGLGAFLLRSLVQAAAGR